METKEVHFASLAKTDSHDCVLPQAQTFPGFLPQSLPFSERLAQTQQSPVCYNYPRYIMKPSIC